MAAKSDAIGRKVMGTNEPILRERPGPYGYCEATVVAPTGHSGDLITQANRFVRTIKLHPRQFDVNRAVSKASSALFHSLARLRADALAGSRKFRRPSMAPDLKRFGAWVREESLPCRPAKGTSRRKLHDLRSPSSNGKNFGTRPATIAAHPSDKLICSS